MKKVLIIPSWYVSAENPGLGNFFRDQALLLSGHFDIKIFAGIQNTNISRLQKLINTFLYIFFGHVHVRPKKDFFIQPPVVFGFEYSCGINKFKRMNYSIQKKAFLKYFKKYILPEWKPDLIHSQNTFIAGIVASEIHEEYLIPYVNQDHHHLNPDLPDYIQKDLIKSTVNAKQNLFVSEWQFRTYLLLNPAIKGAVVGNPVESKDYSILNEDYNKNKFIISHVGNGMWYKDVETLLKTIELFFEDLGANHNIEIRIIGFPANLISQIQEKLSKFEWRKYIVMTSSQPKQKIIEQLQDSNVFLFTSLFESFGIAPLEAMFCGVPVVSTNNGGVLEYLGNGTNGILCDLRDSKALSEALKNIYSGRIKFNKSIVRNSVVEKFNSEVFQQKMISVYQQSMENE